MAETPQCQTCVFWRRRPVCHGDEAFLGSCHRYPPTPLWEGDEGKGDWHASTSEDDWCGEHKLDIDAAAAVLREKARRASEEVSKIVVGAATISAVTEKMSDDKALKIALNPCVCGGTPGLEHFTAAGERRWRVKCPRCSSMTCHYFGAALAVSEWQDRKPEAA